MLDLSGIKDWFVDQIEIILIVGFLIILVVTAYRRQWLMMFMAMLGFAFIGIFVKQPELLLTLAEWLGEKVSIGQG